MKVGSLFSGIGGLDLGLELAGMEVAWQCENDQFARKVLAKHWPEVPCYEDIRTVEWEAVERVDLVCGGFPCQDLSTAGRLAGLHGPRSGLHQEFLHVIEQTSPEWVVIENVYQSWRRWVPQLRFALRERGYASLPLRVRAAEVGSPHIRARGFILAHPDSEKLRELRGRWRWPSREETAELGRAWNQEPQVPRVDDGAAGRLDRNRVIGNAVVPAVAKWIGERIMEAARGRADDQERGLDKCGTAPVPFD